MKIYVDFDDVLCETGRYLSKLAEELFGIKVPYAEMLRFNLKEAFGLNDSQYDLLLKKGHERDVLIASEETPQASQTVNRWTKEGHEVFIITGRAFNTYEPSRIWLDNHNLKNVPLICVDKYGREGSCDWSYGITLEELYGMDFDFAVEDSPVAYEHLMHFRKCTVAVFNRPWNSQSVFPNERFVRCAGWQDIDRLLHDTFPLKED